MELLDGATLRRIVEVDGPQPAGRVVRILAMACGALSEAHSVGLIHRDINLTGPDTVTGTPMYMAPESIRNPDSVDARTDIYALGAVAYYLLTGTDVFDGKLVVEVCGASTKTSSVDVTGRPQ